MGTHISFKAGMTDDFITLFRIIQQNGYICECSAKDSSKCVKKFLNAHLWDGKKLNDVEKEMTWLEPI